MAGNSAQASASFGLAITENWIRERLNLHKDSLDDVRSLSLPGSYSEKITHLGRSLMGFTCLKYLDLSRNALESLDGLQDLKRLETLNLYYNNIPSLKELFKLGHNCKLKNLDLRLNPVTKNEPDYRLFVVHMLVNLRKLDDRAVRDTERKAALMHFDTEQANVFDKQLRQPQLDRPEEVTRDRHPHRRASARADLVKSLASRPTALEDDSDYLLELIAKSDHLMRHPPHHHHHTPHVTSPSHGQRQHHHGSQRPHSHVTPTRRHQAGHQVGRGREQRHLVSTQRCDFSPPREESRQLDLSGSSSDGGGGAGGRYYRSPTEPTRPAGLTPVRGNFAPVPAVQGVPKSGSHLALKQLLGMLQQHVDGDLTTLEQDPNLQDQFLSWYSSHAHLSGVGVVREEMVESLQGEVDALQAELRTMEGHLREKDKGHQDKETRIQELENLLGMMKSESAELSRQLQVEVARSEELGRTQLTAQDSQQRLQQAVADMGLLKQRVQTLQEDNRVLREALERTPSIVQLEKTHRQIGELQSENCALKREMEGTLNRHKQDMHNASQLQELVTMLQESHRSLVATNDHLLQELDEARQKHSQEIMQMNVNYEQLRKTVQHAHNLI